MSVNLLVLTEQSLAATTCDNECLARGFKSHERMSTKGEMLNSSQYDTLLSLNDSLASLFHLSVDDIYAVRYALQGQTVPVAAQQDLSVTANSASAYSVAAQQLSLETDSAEQVAFAQSLRFYTMDAQAPLDLALLRANFAGVLFFFTSALSPRSLIAPELLTLLEALTRDSSPDLHDRLPLLIFNLRFALNDFAAYQQLLQAHDLAPDANIWGERYRVTHRVLKLCGWAHSIGVGTQSSLVALRNAALWEKNTPSGQSQHNLHSSPQLFLMPQALLSCQFTERVQSFLRLMRLLSQLDADSGNRGEDDSGFKRALRAPFPVQSQPQSQPKVDGLGRGFVLPVWQQQRLVSLTLPQSPSAANSPCAASSAAISAASAPAPTSVTSANVTSTPSAPLTIALASRYLRYHPIFGLSPMAVCILSAIYQAFPRARVLLFFGDNWYSWADSITDSEVLLAQEAALNMSATELACSLPHTSSYLALSDALVQQINKQWSRQYVILQWLRQAGPDLAVALGLSPAPQSTSDSGNASAGAGESTAPRTVSLSDLAAALTTGSVSEVTSLKTYGQQLVQAWHDLEQGNEQSNVGGNVSGNASSFEEASAKVISGDDDDLALDLDLDKAFLFGGEDSEWQSFVHPLVQSCYVQFSYDQEFPTAVDLVLSDQEGLLLTASQQGIACLALQDDLKDASWHEISLAYFKAVQSWDFGGELPELLAERMEFWYEHLRHNNPTLLQADAYVHSPAKGGATGADSDSASSDEFSGFFVSVPLSTLVQQLDLRSALGEQISVWTTERIQEHLQAQYKYNLYLRQLLYHTFASGLEASTTGLNTQVQLSTYTHAQRYELQWLFLRFFAALAQLESVPNAEASPVVEGAPTVVTLSSVVATQVQLTHSVEQGGEQGAQEALRVRADAPAMLSFGCARGDELGDLCHYFPQYLGVGVDINPHVLARARERYAFFVAQGSMAPERLHFVLSADLPQFLASWAGPQRFALVTAMTVLCRHPETMGVANAHALYTFTTFKQQIEELCSYVAPHGLLCVHNANYCVEDSALSVLQDFCPLFPFPQEVELCPVPEHAALAVKVTVAAQDFMVSMDMAAVDYWRYLLAQVQHCYQVMRGSAEAVGAGAKSVDAINVETLPCLYLPALLLRAYERQSKSAKWGYTACFNAQEEKIARIGATMFYRRK